MRILVTGAAGFIATNLLPRLLKEGHEVVGVDNMFLGKKEYLAPFLDHPKFKFHQSDLVQLDPTLAIFESFKPELVWHLAANSDIAYGTAHTDFDLKGGTIVTYNVLESMRRVGTKKFMFSSSGAIYGEPKVMPTPEDYGPILPISLYAASKLACEGLIGAYVHNYEIQAWVYRFGNIIGPNPTHGAIYDFVLKLKKDNSKLPVLGDGTQLKQYVYVEDCLDGMQHGFDAATDALNLFNLTAKGQTNVKYIAEHVLAAMDMSHVPIAYGGGNRGWKGDVPVVSLDGSRMKKIGWEPKLTSTEAVDKAIADTVRQIGKS